MLLPKPQSLILHARNGPTLKEFYTLTKITLASALVSNLYITIHLLSLQSKNRTGAIVLVGCSSW